MLQHHVASPMGTSKQLSLASVALLVFLAREAVHSGAFLIEGRAEMLLLLLLVVLPQLLLALLVKLLRLHLQV